MSIKEKLNSVRETIIQSAIESGRSPHEIKLIAVSKKKPIEMIKEAISANQIIFGENYVQEALEKIKKIGKNQEIEWHFLGHLQKVHESKILQETYFVKPRHSLLQNFF